MKIREFWKLMNRLEEEGLRFEVVDDGEGYRTLCFEVDDEPEFGNKLLSEATNAEIIQYADEIGYAFTEEDCEALRNPSVRALTEGETVSEAVNDFVDAFE